jgi:hypothetical protein
MDTKEVLRLLILLFVATTGLVYYVLFMRVHVLPTPESFGTFEEHYQNYILNYSSPKYHSTIQSMGEFQL